MSPEEAYSSIIVGRLLGTLYAETAFLRPDPTPRRARLAPDLEISLGWPERRVAGVDEAGRGPLAGPVVAAAVCLRSDGLIPGLDDSKRLAPHAREALLPRILESAEAVGVGLVTEAGIDAWNIREAAREAMIRAVRRLGALPDWVLVDGTRLDPFPFPQVSVVGGDRTVPSIAAASIVAKVARDRLMRAYDRLYPVYGFEGHKGYPTEEHALAIARHGMSPIHRSTFHVPEYGNPPGRPA